ncbi:uncharacterized protein LOC115727907 [Rhodamnia argentea]|uniref:Uncharacterized protein LOC115727907 n=1 Tax=Rhodamnia argentea TaxID=178133 RepID=A0A8B8MVQ4_9MYRT|nr:uncharacterized protein LOC115727907 [Rhodamnia argentea]
MALYHLVVLVSLFMVPRSESATFAFNRTDLQVAVDDMRSRSFFGFAILLQMLNRTSEPNEDLTFLIPTDPELSAPSIAVNHLEEFLFSHSIRMPLSFHDLLHFPTGTLVPSGYRNQLFRIHNRGRLSFFVNNARVITPNVCSNSMIKCHGIDAVIEFEHFPRNEKVKVSLTNSSAPPPMEAPSPA